MPKSMILGLGLLEPMVNDTVLGDSRLMSWRSQCKNKDPNGIKKSRNMYRWCALIIMIECGSDPKVSNDILQPPRWIPTFRSIATSG